MVESERTETALQKAVVLCACHGELTRRLPLEAIGQFLSEMAPDTRVVVADDLCRRGALRRFSRQQGLQPSVIGACSQVRPSLYFWEDTARADVNPYATRVVDLLAEAAVPYSNTQLAERARLLLLAQLKRARQFKGISHDQMRLDIGRSRRPISRRDLFAMPLLRYEAVPYIESHRCAGIERCGVCQQCCPTGAIAADGDAARIDKSGCRKCGACMAVCPHLAISYPSFSHEELDAELAGLLETRGVSIEPRIVALACQSCVPAADGDGAERFAYPPNVLPMQVPCLAMASPWFMLHAFDRGAQGLALLCGASECIVGLDAAHQDNVQFVEAVLDYWGVAASRLRLFKVGEHNRIEIERGLADFASAVAGFALIPSREPKSDNPQSGRPGLPALITSRSGREPSPLTTIAGGAVPFGKLILDQAQCTACGLCALHCSTGALIAAPSDGAATWQLLFSHESCVACGACIKACPESCLKLDRVLELGQLGRAPTALFEDSIARCRRCGAPTAPQSMLSKLRAMLVEHGGPTSQLELCPACRMSAMTLSPLRLSHNGDDGPIAAKPSEEPLRSVR